MYRLRSRGCNGRERPLPAKRALPAWPRNALGTTELFLRGPLGKYPIEVATFNQLISSAVPFRKIPGHYNNKARFWREVE